MGGTFGGSSEPAVDVVGGARVARVLEHLRGGARLDDAARLVLGGEEEGAVVATPAGPAACCG